MPNSKRTALATKRPNWTATGSSRPSSWRSRWRSSSDVSWPTIWLTGSPTKRNSTKARSATVTMTKAASSSRRMANASMSPEWCVGQRRCRGFLTLRRRPRFLLHLRPVEEDLVVGAQHHLLHLLRHAPDQRLLMQRDQPDLLVVDAEGLSDQLVALLGVGLDEDQLVELRYPRIAPTAQVESGAFAVGVAAADDVLEDVPAVERSRRPAEKTEGAIVLARCQDLLKILCLRLGVELHLDVDARKHLRHRLADPLVVDVAIVRAIHDHLEAVGVAGFRQQLLSRGHIVGVALELGRAGIKQRRDHQRGVDGHVAHDL